MFVNRVSFQPQMRPFSGDSDNYTEKAEKSTGFQSRRASCRLCIYLAFVWTPMQGQGMPSISRIIVGHNEHSIDTSAYLPESLYMEW